ncbi:MAG: LLM class flavin-dependent oxidoreductase [Acidimicrobiia bacterium]|nr:LLM class flavin-dependent oxidoreductase [Acidimicrobiia bacterium]
MWPSSAGTTPSAGRSRRAWSWHRRAEAGGYRRIWYAEHHNIRSIASSATSVLIAHVAAHTERIRLGAGRDHAPQPRAPVDRRAVRHARSRSIPGRIDLGLGPGARQRTRPP